MALKLSHPATFLLCGPSFCGKTHWMFRFIENRNEIFTEKIEKVYYFYDTYQKKFDDCMSEIDFMIHGVPSLEVLKKTDRCLLVLDDLMHHPQDVISVPYKRKKTRNFFQHFRTEILRIPASFLSPKTGVFVSRQKP